MYFEWNWFSNSFAADGRGINRYGNRHSGLSPPLSYRSTSERGDHRHLQCGPDPLLSISRWKKRVTPLALQPFTITHVLWKSQTVVPHIRRSTYRGSALSLPLDAPWIARPRTSGVRPEVFDRSSGMNLSQLVFLCHQLGESPPALQHSVARVVL